jgi:hypothetical protein
MDQADGVSTAADQLLRVLLEGAMHIPATLKLSSGLPIVNPIIHLERNKGFGMSSVVVGPDAMWV